MAVAVVRRLAVFAVVASVSALGACAGEPTAPASSGTPEVVAHRASRGGRGRQANGRRYRDSGRHKWRGKSVNASLDAEALRNADGTVTLEVTSFRANDGAVPAGTITRIQVKVLDGSGRQVAVVNANQVSGNPVSVRVPAVPDGGSLRVMALVTDLPGRRTDVVTVTGITPTRRPDLAVTAVNGPVQVVPGQPVVLAATVAELGGEHGADANCVLTVDGARTDVASAIWVDAGDVVTCAFTWSFAAVGTAEVGVSVERVDPADADPSNNRGAFAVRVVAPDAGAPDNFSFTAAIRDGVMAFADSIYNRWTERGTGRLWFEQVGSYRAAGRTQTVLVSALIGAGVPLPLTRLEVAMRSGGRLLHAARWDGFGADASGDPACASETSPGGFSVFFCSYGAGGFATIQYVLSAGSVTYQSVEYNKTWNGATYDENTWVDNTTDPAVPVPPQQLGTDFAFHISATVGGASYAFGGSGPLGPVSEREVLPLACATSVFDGPPTFDVLACASSDYSFTGTAGALNGTGYLSRSPVMP